MTNGMSSRAAALAAVTDRSSDIGGPARRHRSGRSRARDHGEAARRWPVSRVWTHSLDRYPASIGKQRPLTSPGAVELMNSAVRCHI